MNFFGLNTIHNVCVSVVKKHWTNVKPDSRMYAYFWRFERSGMLTYCSATWLWRWRHYDPSKRRKLWWYGIKSQKTYVFIITTARTSNLTMSSPVPLVQYRCTYLCNHGSTQVYTISQRRLNSDVHAPFSRALCFLPKHVTFGLITWISQTTVHEKSTPTLNSNIGHTLFFWCQLCQPPL